MVYLDAASTTKPCFFAKDYAQYWANPNSNHALGLQANQALNEARQRIMDCLGVKSGKVLFCRCATEAIEWLTQSLVKKYEKEQRLSNSPRYHIPCSKYEHDSVFDCCGDIFSTTNRLKDWMMPKEIYLHQHTNHITGTIFDIESIGKQVQSTGAFFGSDITASLGHYPLPDNIDTFCDALWFSGRKIHCETMGAIWISDRLFKYLGGSEDSRNEFGLLRGTTNVPGAIALSYAMEHAIDGLEDGNDEHWRSLLGYLEIKLLGNRIDCNIIAKDQPKTHAINALYLPGFNADALTNFLSSHGVYISPGHSACSSNAADATRVLEAFGLTKEQASQTVRVSFGESTSQEDIDALVKGIVEFKNLFI